MAKLSVAIVLIVLAVGISHGHEEAKETLLLNLVYLGTYAGKRYYSDTTATGSQTTGRSRCSNQGMQLVTIGTQAELTYLQSIVGTTIYWTAGKAGGTYVSSVNPALTQLAPTYTSDSYIGCLAVQTAYLGTRTCSTSLLPLCSM